MTFTIELSHSPTETEREQLHQHLRAHNTAVSPWHRAAREPGAIEPLALFVRDAAGEIIGGLTADTYWDSWLEIADLWLDDSLRGQGLGAALLHRAEIEAMVRGCTRAHLQTFSFQARDFYRKYGWRVVGALEDFPPGETFYWMRKDFGRPAEHVSFKSVQSDDDVLAYLTQINRKFPARPQVVRHIQAQLAALPQKKPAVVELCHGPGLLARRLICRLPHMQYTGFDFSGAFVRFTGRQLAPFGDRATVIQADLNAGAWLAQLPAAVHAIVSLQSLHDLGGEAEVSRIYRLARERLAPGGLFLNADLVVPEEAGVIENRVNESLGGHPAGLPTGAAKPANPGRLPVSRHLELLHNLGFDAVACTLQLDEFACVVGTTPPG